MRDNQDTLLHKGRRNLLVQQLRESGRFEERVLKAIGAVPRHLFVEEGLEDFAYKDTPVAIGAAQTISQPSTVALETQLLNFKPGDRILEIGTGCGYQSAVLFYLGAEVFSIERQAELFPTAVSNLEAAGYLFLDEELAAQTPTNINSGKFHLYLGDGYLGLPAEAPFDGIVVTCGAPHIPQKLLEQLKVGARMVIPVDFEKEAQGREKKQMLKVITRVSEGRYQAEDIGLASFVPMLEGINGK